MSRKNKLKKLERKLTLHRILWNKDRANQFHKNKCRHYLYGLDMYRYRRKSRVRRPLTKTQERIQQGLMLQKLLSPSCYKGALGDRESIYYIGENWEEETRAEIREEERRMNED